MATEEARLEYNRKYGRQNFKQVVLKFHRDYDSDILERLQSAGNTQGYIKRLIREDIKRNKTIEPEPYPRKYTEEEIEEAMVLLDDLSYTVVSERTGINVQTLTKEWRKRHPNQTKKPPEIHRYDDYKGLKGK